MFVVDANVLLYAVNADLPHHAEAREWLDGALAGSETVAFSWVALLAFLRLSTSARVFTNPLPPEQALEVVESWLAQPAAATVDPVPGHVDILRRLLGQVGTSANHVTDAHLAALAIQHRATLVSFDADFARYGGLRWRRPGD